MICSFLYNSCHLDYAVNAYPITTLVLIGIWKSTHLHRLIYVDKVYFLYRILRLNPYGTLVMHRRIRLPSK